MIFQKIVISYYQNVLAGQNFVRIVIHIYWSLHSYCKLKQLANWWHHHLLITSSFDIIKNGKSKKNYFSVFNFLWTCKRNVRKILFYKGKVKLRNVTPQRVFMLKLEFLQIKLAQTWHFDFSLLFSFSWSFLFESVTTIPSMQLQQQLLRVTQFFGSGRGLWFTSTKPRTGDFHFVMQGSKNNNILLPKLLLVDTGKHHHVIFVVVCMQSELLFSSW